MACNKNYTTRSQCCVIIKLNHILTVLYGTAESLLKTKCIAERFVPWLLMYEADASEYIFIIYRPGAREIRRNISRSDDIFRGALSRGIYHH